MNELNVRTPSGANVYATVRQLDGSVWNGAAFVPWNNPDVATYALPLVDRGGDYYSSDFPAGITAPGRYYASYYRRGGTVPTNSDFNLPADDMIDWLGSAITPVSHYGSGLGVRTKVGSDNTDLWADLDNDNNGAAINVELEDSLSESDGEVNLVLGTLSPPPLALGAGELVASSYPWVNAVIADAANLIAAGILLNKRWQQQGSTGDVRPGDGRIADGKAKLLALVAMGLPGVTTETEDETPDPGTVEFVTIDRGQCNEDEYAGLI